MNNRTKTLWVPGLISLTGSMACRLVLQRSIGPSQTLLNHAGLPLIYQLLWLAALPLFGAASAHLSRPGWRRSIHCRDRGSVSGDCHGPPLDRISDQDESSIPSPVVWSVLWRNELDCHSGRSPVLRRVALPESSPWNRLEGKREQSDKDVLAASAGQSNDGNGLSDDLELGGPATSICSARVVNSSCLHPLAARFAVLRRLWRVFISPRRGRNSGSLGCSFISRDRDDQPVGFLMLIGKFVYARPHWLYFSIALEMGVVFPGAALLLGAMPFAKPVGRRSFSV